MLRVPKRSCDVDATPSDDDPPPVAPTPPDDDACCGGGCNPCIFDLFEAARERYLAELRAWQERQARPLRP